MASQRLGLFNAPTKGVKSRQVLVDKSYGRS
jgi:hypothetical protein